MNKSEIRSSADMFFYKAIVDLNSGKHLVQLNDYAIEGRYSIIHDDINEADRYCYT